MCSSQNPLKKGMPALLLLLPFTGIAQAKEDGIGREYRMMK